jgi:hypothetical protein
METSRSSLVPPNRTATLIGYPRALKVEGGSAMICLPSRVHKERREEIRSGHVWPLAAPLVCSMRPVGARLARALEWHLRLIREGMK